MNTGYGCQTALSKRKQNVYMPAALLKYEKPGA